MRMYQLCRALCAIPVDHEKLSGILAKVANFRSPTVRERGYYCLRPEWWMKFDPLFPLFSTIELEDAKERAGSLGKQQFYWRIVSVVQWLFSFIDHSKHVSKGQIDADVLLLTGGIDYSINHHLQLQNHLGSIRMIFL
ncbi:unnamed protein product [Sphagnum jensenii]|uniref:E3 ubiquitin-protein ligase UBR1-like winged-helix domain-containing protein n=1 Tax=Sphagnum jensenii TaxID=128206 RepID=A0ABP1BND4_9BRYO